MEEATVEPIPDPHQRVIAKLTERGFVAGFRQWAMGDTVQVVYGSDDIPGCPIQLYRRGAYLVPAENGLWGVLIGVDDPDPVPEDVAIERIIHLLVDDGAFEAEFHRRCRLLKIDGDSVDNNS